MRVWLAIFAAVGGCGDNEKQWRLSELSSKHLSTHVSFVGCSALLSYAALGFGLSPDDCPVLDSTEVHATLGGFPLTFGLFGFQPAPDMLPGGSCSMGFGNLRCTPENGLVTISDSSLEIVGRFEQSALESRFATHPDWSFGLGETVTLRWSHPSDLVGVDTSATVVLYPAAGGGGLQSPVTIVPPDLLTFVVPSNHPTEPTRAIVSVESRPYVDVALECVNATTCRATQERTDAHDATVY